ncbi:hypothetical protein G9272_07645 [Streptomyces asoensis]|uniref:Gram-positive cocci surface proteins LPxTG domain-containing protein n=1 Tax=Streptomyces asoensis TaxID=249586 RepID=A0A6M4WHV1_9ACTN|nr:hypothetical protein [Streptomyces asoensis]QJT00170.1 hypothetical protein G9272_07645 [Streptomyces asoensis]
MRSARMILATAAASAALAIGASGAYAAGDTDHDDSSWSKEDSSSYSKEHDKEEHGKEEHGKEDHDSPHGGIHTGGGALASVSDSGDHSAAKDPKYDPETYKDKDEHGKDSWNGGKEEESGGWSKEHDKPSGGVHTGGGALATPSATAAGLGVLAVAGTGLYALRRKKTVGGVA